MGVFLFKTEPSTYSWDDLVREKRAVWDGISNPVALRHLGTIKKGDDVLVYHTGDVKAVVGLGRAASDAYPDPKNPGRPVVDLEPERPLKHPVALATFRVDPVLRTADIVRIPRLSVVPLTGAQLARVLELAEG